MKDLAPGFFSSDVSAVSQRLSRLPLSSMDYMLLCYTDEKEWAGLPATHRERVLDGCRAFTEELRESGHLRAVGRLQPSTTATTVRGQNGKSVMTDGPFTETKEMLAGFFHIACQDHAEAVAIAARFPKLTWGGSLEVRPFIMGE